MEAPHSLAVTVDSFAAHLTINDDGLKYGDLIPEEAKLTSVKRQVWLGSLQVKIKCDVLHLTACHPSI